MADKLVLTLVAAALATFAGACGGTPKHADAPEPSSTAPASTDSGPSDTEAPATEKKGELNDAQEEQMIIALRRGGDKAAQCVDVVPDAPRGEGSVDVLFDGGKGRVVDASVGPPFAGTPVEACIKRAFIGEIVLPFEGPPKSVPYSVKLPEKPAEAAPAKDDKKPGAKSDKKDEKKSDKKGAGK